MPSIPMANECKYKSIYSQRYLRGTALLFIPFSIQERKTNTWMSEDEKS